MQKIQVIQDFLPELQKQYIPPAAFCSLYVLYLVFAPFRIILSMSLRGVKRRSNLKTYDYRLPRRLSDGSQWQTKAHLLNTIGIRYVLVKNRIDLNRPIKKDITNYISTILCFYELFLIFYMAREVLSLALFSSSFKRDKKCHLSIILQKINVVVLF